MKLKTVVRFLMPTGKPFLKHTGALARLRQQNIILGRTQKVKKKQCKLNSTRGDPIKYFFENNLGQRVDVCVKFFLHTLDISKRTVHYSLKRAVHGKSYLMELLLTVWRRMLYNVSNFTLNRSTRWKTTTHVQLPNVITLKLVSRFQNSTPYFKSLSFIAKRQEVKESYYAKVFNENYNIGFQVPNKDACDTCTERKRVEMKPLRQQKSLKIILQERKRRGNTGSKISSQMFNGASYYKRELNCYDLTVY